MITAILKALGIKITPEQAAQLEVVIPQIPARAAEVIQLVNVTAGEMIRRIDSIEQRQIMILNRIEMLQSTVRDSQDILDVLVVQTSSDSSTRAAGMGGAGRLLVMGEVDKLPAEYVNDIPEVVRGSADVEGDLKSA